MTSHNNLSSPAHLRAKIARIKIDKQRRGYQIADNHNLQATNHVVNGTSLIVGIGEVIVDVKFPVAYIRSPAFTYGGELSHESVAVEGSFPTVSAVVSQWYIDDPDVEVYGASMRKYFRGAKLACVVTGPGTQKLNLHWSFTGMALTNPGGGAFSVPPSSSQGGGIV